jgi:hypothetical protein
LIETNIASGGKDRKVVPPNELTKLPLAEFQPVRDFA